MSARTVVRWYTAEVLGKVKVYRVEVVEGTLAVGDVTLYETRDEAVAAQNAEVAR